MSGLTPSMVRAMQKEGKNPLLYSSAFGEPRINALGRRYKLGKASGSKYYEQSNGSWSLNLPKVSLTPDTKESMPLIAEVEPPKEQILNGKDPRSRPPERRYAPAIEAPAIEAPAIEAPAEQYMNGKDPRSRPPSRASPPSAPNYNRPPPYLRASVASPPAAPVENNLRERGGAAAQRAYQLKYGPAKKNSNSSRKSRRHRASRKHRRTYRK